MDCEAVLGIAILEEEGLLLETKMRRVAGLWEMKLTAGKRLKAGAGRRRYQDDSVGGSTKTPARCRRYKIAGGGH